MLTFALSGLFLATVCAGYVGIRLARTPRFSSRLLPFSGGVLMGIAAFWIVPEMAEQYGWAVPLAGLAAGFALLLLINRYIYAVCPACAHSHDHDNCAERLHGFAIPLITASSLHAFLDGSALAVVNQQGSESVRAIFFLGISIHKVPEGIALGVLLLAATGSAWKAWLGCAAIQSFMLAGGLAGSILSSHLTPGWVVSLLSLSAGIFVYLGYHAIEGEYRERGLVTAIMPALTGAAGAAALRFVPGL